MLAPAQRPSATTPDPSTVEFAAMIAADALAEFRTAGDHEAGGRAEADMQAAVRRIFRASPAVRAAFSGVLATTDTNENPQRG